MEKNNKIIIASGIVSVLVIFMGVAFASLTSNLNISFGNVTQNSLSWNVGFKGNSAMPTQEGTSSAGLSCGTVTITPSTVTISDSTLSKPGDKCTYSLIIQNSGDVAANLSNISAIEPTSTSCTITNGSTMVCGKLTYKLTTTSGSALTTGITINKNEDYKINLIISYTGEELNSKSVTQSNAKFTLTYAQSENRTESTTQEGIKASIVCKRATTLHTEICENNGWSSNGCVSAGYNNGDTITYGSLGTDGTLSAGDAFDCDVNGDRIYDSSSERFYYVSGLDGDNTSDYAVLIYSANLDNGSDDRRYDYSTHNINYNGPTIAYLELPTKTQWPNVSLSNETRQIYTIDDTTSTIGGDLPRFTYTSRAARLLSHKEVNAACGITIGNATEGELDSKCEFMLEDAVYAKSSEFSQYESGWAWLLESVDSTERYNNLYAVFGEYRSVLKYSSAAGIRPAIEVPLSDIAY